MKNNLAKTISALALSTALLLSGCNENTQNNQTKTTEAPQTTAVEPKKDFDFPYLFDYMSRDDFDIDVEYTNFGYAVAREFDKTTGAYKGKIHKVKAIMNRNTLAIAACGEDTVEEDNIPHLLNYNRSIYKIGKDNSEYVLALMKLDMDSSMKWSLCKNCFDEEKDVKEFKDYMNSIEEYKSIDLENFIEH